MVVQMFSRGGPVLPPSSPGHAYNSECFHWLSGVNKHWIYLECEPAFLLHHREFPFWGGKILWNIRRKIVVPASWKKFKLESETSFAASILSSLWMNTHGGVSLIHWSIYRKALLNTPILTIANYKVYVSVEVMSWSMIT